MEDNTRSVLSKIWYGKGDNLGASFGGPSKLYHEAKKFLPGLTMTMVNDFLKRQPAYISRHEEPKNTVLKRWQPTRSFQSNHPNQYWIIDTLYMNKYGGAFPFLLTCIDLFSRYGRMQPLKKLNADSMTRAMQKMFDNAGTIPKTIVSDNGVEFKAGFHQMLVDKGIGHMFSNPRNPNKTSVVERLHRTLRLKVGRILDSGAAKIPLVAFKMAMESYNHQYHRSIGISPTQALKPANMAQVIQYELKQKSKLLDKLGGPLKRKFHVGSMVYLRKKSRSKFFKSSDPVIENQKYVITGIKPTLPMTSYYLKTSMKPHISLQGSYPENWLIPANND